MSSKSLKDVLQNEELRKVFLSVKSTEEAYEFVLKNGFAGSADDFRKELSEIKQELILSQGLDEQELGRISGGGYGPHQECSVSQCHDTYDSDDPCLLDDYCEYFLNLYCAGDPMNS